MPGDAVDSASTARAGPPRATFDACGFLRRRLRARRLGAARPLRASAVGGERRAAWSSAALPRRRFGCRHAALRRACRPLRLPAPGLGRGPMHLCRSAFAGDPRQRPGAGVGPAPLRRGSRRDGCGGEHPGDHRGEGLGPGLDVRFPRALQRRRNPGRRRRQRRALGWRIAFGRRPGRRSGDPGHAGDLRAPSAALWERGRAPVGPFRPAPWRGADHRPALLHYLPGGRLHPGLERHLPDLGAPGGSEPVRPGLCRLRLRHDPRPLRRRSHQAGRRRPEQS